MSVYPAGTGDLDVVRTLFAAFSARDREGCLAVLHPDLQFWAQPTAELADRGDPYRGHDGFRAYLDDVERVWASFSVAPGNFRAAAGGVICFGEAVGVPRDGGEERRQPVIWVFRLRDGLVAFCRVARTAEEATRMAAGLPSDHEETP